MRTPEQRFWAKVTKTRTCWLWTAGRDRDGYGRIQVSGRNVKAHRYSYLLHNGTLPPEVDHSCRVKHCVNPRHLRAASRKQNAENLPGATRINNTSGTRGVTRRPSGKWRAQVVHNWRVHVKTFTERKDAERWVIETRARLYTHSDDPRRGVA